MTIQTLRQVLRHALSALALISLSYVASWNSQASTNTLPNLGSSDLVEYTPEKEAELGRAFKSALHNEYRIVSDPDINQYIRQIGQRITQQTGEERNFSFYVIEHPSINAFAGPDGVIGIHTGLIQAVTNEDELASVIAHEIAHVTQNHLSRRFETQSGNSVSSIASLLAAILIGMHDPSAGMAALMGGMGANMQQQLKYSRIHEAEADSAGIDYLYQSGYDPFAMGDFFGRLAMKYRHNEFKPLEILSTHPVTEHRLAEAQNRAQQYQPLVYQRDPLTLRLIKQRVQTLTKTTDPVLRQTRLTSIEHCYLEALKFRKNSNETIKEKGITCLQEAIQEHPRQKLLQTMLLELVLSSDTFYRKPFVTKQIAMTRELFPQNSSVLIKQAQLLNRTGQHQTAIDLLEKEIPAHNYQFHLYEMLSRIYAQQQRTGYAYLSKAKAYFNIGNIKRTRINLEKAESSAESASPDLKSKIHQFTKNKRNLLKPNSKN